MTTPIMLDIILIFSVEYYLTENYLKPASMMTLSYFLLQFKLINIAIISVWAFQKSIITLIYLILSALR